jgi:hypothetical protein
VAKKRLKPFSSRLATTGWRVEGPFKLSPGTKVVATVTLAGKKPANVRFTLK